MTLRARSVGRALGLAALAFGAWGLAEAQAVNPGVAARVNGAEISNETWQRNYREYLRENNVNIVTSRDPEKLEDMRFEALDLLIEQELVWQAAKAQGVVAPDELVDASIEELLGSFPDADAFSRRITTEGYTEESYREHVRRLLSAQRYLDGVRMAAGEVSDEELEQFYQDNKIRLTYPEEVRVRHVLLTWKPMGTADDRGAIRRQMEGILAEARGGADFAELARTRSEDSTAKNGGDTGFFHRGQMVPAFEDVAFSLKPGEISDMVETPFGVHILTLVDRREAELLPLDEVREKLRDYVSREKMKQAADDEVARLRGEAEIQILAPR